MVNGIYIMLGFKILTSLLGLSSLVYSRSTLPVSSNLHSRKRAPPSDPFQNIITGLYSVPPQLVIHDRSGNVHWSFSRNDVTQQLPGIIKNNLDSNADDATEVKWINNGASIAAVYGDLVVIINYRPGQSGDKEITFALPRGGTAFANTHTLEPLPGRKIAVSTTGERPWDGIIVYDANTPVANDPPPILQNITGLRVAHGLLWDDTESILWAAGNDAAADGSDGLRANITLKGYPFDQASGQLNPTNSQTYKLPDPQQLQTEWGPGYPWWSGPHDLVGVPNQRKVIISTDRDLHVFDLEKRQFTESGADVVNNYLQGFEAVGNRQNLPRSDVKSIGLSPDGAFVYVQTPWQQVQANETNVVANGSRNIILPERSIYRSRFFANTPGFPKPGW